MVGLTILCITTVILLVTAVLVWRLTRDGREQNTLRLMAVALSLLAGRSGLLFVVHRSQGMDPPHLIAELLILVIATFAMSVLALTGPTMRKLARTQDALRTEEEKYRALFQNANDAIFLYSCTPEGMADVILEVNEVACRRLGYRAEELAGKTLREFNDYSHLDADTVLRNTELFQREGQITYETFHLPKGGGRFPVEITAHRFLLNGRPVILSIARDITERRQMEDALRRAEERYRRIFEEAPIGIFQTTLDGRYLAANPETARLHGYASPEELMRDITSIGEQLYVDPIIREETMVVVERSRGYESFEPTLKRKDGSTFIGSLRLRAVRDAAGNIRHLEGFLEDITAQRQRQWEQRASLELSHLMSGDGTLQELLESTVSFLREWSGCEAVALRLREGDDFPYVRTVGFPDEFVAVERCLTMADADGNLARAADGTALLACMCGNVINGRTDPAQPFFTTFGSFWTNSTTELLATTTEAERQSPTRDQCRRAGYESVALIPLRSGTDTVGLVQFNDRQPGRFTREFIVALESFADKLGIAIAQRQAEEALRESTRLAADIVQAVPIGIFIYQLEPSGRLILQQSNPAAEQMTGIRAAEWAGKEFTEIWTGEDVEQLQRIYKQVIETGTVYQHDVYPYRDTHVDGTFRLRAFPVAGRKVAVLFENVTPAGLPARDRWTGNEYRGIE
ncbi:MAG: PAS domain S-box protein [Armatimonadota bacterium]